jgi:hypothetical protein
MRVLLRLFALLDVISIVFMTPQVWAAIIHHDEMPATPLLITKVVFTVLIFFSLFITAAGLFMQKKYGLVTYYIQFPFRLLLWIFSIGFITFLPELFNKGDQWFGGLFRICIVAEFFRCYYTVQAHRMFFRKQVSPQ